MNTDRHAGNILVRKLPLDESLGRMRPFSDESVCLIPIDHGLCLPESFEDPYFEWLHWPQASVPFSEEELQYIAALDPFKDAELLKKELPTLRESALQILVICTLFLQRGAAAGLTLAQIGGMMSRGVCGVGEEESELEEVFGMAFVVMMEEEGAYDIPFEDDPCAEFEQFAIDDINDYDSWSYEREGERCSPFRSPVSVIGGVNGGFHYNYGTSPLASPMSPRVGSISRGKTFSGGVPLILEDLMEAVDEDVDDPVSPSPVCTPHSRARKTPSPPPWEKHHATSASMTDAWDFSHNTGGAHTLRSTSLNMSRHRNPNVNQDNRALRGPTSASEMTRNPNDLHSTVDMPEMNSSQWTRFLQLFEGLLPVLFDRFKVVADKYPLPTRLGTSCQF